MGRLQKIVFIGLGILSLLVSALISYFPVRLAILAVGFGVVWVFLNRKTSEEKTIAAENSRPLPTIQPVQTNVPSAPAAPPAPVTDRKELSELLTCLDELSLMYSRTQTQNDSVLNGIQEKVDKVTGIVSTTANTFNFINDNFTRTYDLSNNVSSTANTAFELAAAVQTGIQSINSALKASTKRSEELLNQSEQISKILSFMSNIAEQINVLSINASVVSARAGAQGREFGVVAKEVRKLAGDTDKFVQDIAQLIGEIKKTIDSVIAETRSADEKSSNETHNLMSVAGSLQGVLLAVEVIHTVSSSSKDTITQEMDNLRNLTSLIRELTTLSCAEKDDAAQFNDLSARIKDTLNGMQQRLS